MKRISFYRGKPREKSFEDVKKSAALGNSATFINLHLLKGFLIRWKTSVRHRTGENK